MTDKSPPLDTNLGFAALGLDKRLLEVLTSLGYEEPTPIQKEAIPILLAGRDLVGQAATGTGKTAAFALPLIQRLAASKVQKVLPRALILLPTRELAMQVAEAVHRYGRALNIRVLPIYGGQAYEPQIRALQRGIDVVVATPGRALDHLRRGTMQLSAINTVVLDEADEMLDLGFLDDIEEILKATPAERQVMLFSATMAPRIASIAKRHLSDPVRINIEREKVAAGEAPRVRQTAYIVPRAHKMEALGRLLDLEDPTSAIIFCRTRTEVDELTEVLRAHSYRAESLHGGMNQTQRERVIKRLKAGQADLVVATDVAARGLDIDHLSHVINFDVPSAPEAYVHRIGRVGRAGREGVALTLAQPREHRMLSNIERITKQKIIISKLPSYADVAARKLEQTKQDVQESLAATDLDRYRPLVESLANDADIFQVALAAMRLLHLSGEAQGRKAGANAAPSQEQERPREQAERPRGGGYGGSRDQGERPRGGYGDRPRDHGARSRNNSNN